MKITIERTSLVVRAHGVLMQVWEGKTESGARIACLVDRLMIESEDRSPQADAEMKSPDRDPSPAVVVAFPEVVETDSSARAPRPRSSKPARTERRRHA